MSCLHEFFMILINEAFACQSYWNLTISLKFDCNDHHNCFGFGFSSEVYKIRNRINKVNQNINRQFTQFILNHSKTAYLNIDRVSILHCLFNKQLVISYFIQTILLSQDIYLKYLPFCILRNIHLNKSLLMQSKGSVNSNKSKITYYTRH